MNYYSLEFGLVGLSKLGNYSLILLYVSCLNTPELEFDTLQDMLEDW